MIKEQFSVRLDRYNASTVATVCAQLDLFEEPDFRDSDWMEKASNEIISRYLCCDAIVVLGASADWLKKSQRWNQGAIVKNDPMRVVGGKSRAIAVAELHQRGYTGPFLITGGMQKDNISGMSISRASLLAKATLGVRMRKKDEKNNIVTDSPIEQNRIHTIGQSNSGTTQGNIADVIDWLQVNVKKEDEEYSLGIMTNGWHLPRAGIMFGQESWFKENGIKLILVNADLILACRSPYHAQWARDFSKLDHGGIENMGNRIDCELKGIHALLNGTYKSSS